MAKLQPHWKTPVLGQQLPTLGFGLPTNAGSIFPGKPAPGQFPHFALKPVVTKWRQRLPFFRTQEICIPPPGYLGFPSCLSPPDSFRATLGLTSQHRLVARGKSVSQGYGEAPNVHPSRLQHSQLSPQHHCVPAQPALGKDMQRRAQTCSSGTPTRLS